MVDLSGSNLNRNVARNLAGHGVPVLAALVAVPLLLEGLGRERFALVALGWTLVTFVGLLDLGVGRAVTYLVASSAGLEEESRIGRLAGTAAGAAAALGMMLAAALLVASPALVHHVLEVPAWLRPEAVAGLRILAFAVPAVLLGNVLRGVLEARQRFGGLAVIRAGLGTGLLLGPVAAIQVAPTLIPVVWTLVVVRWLALVALAVLARRAAPLPWRADPAELAVLARLGGWMTVSTIVGSLMLYADRFVVAGLLSLEAVALYAAPFEVIQRLAILPAAVTGVFFPAFSQRLAAEDGAVPRLYARSRWLIVALVAPAAIGLAVFSRPLLTMWLGAEVAEQSATVASLLAIGALVHGLVQPPFHLLQAAGRPDVPARFQLVEAPLYAVYLVALTLQLGIVGTALAWLVRVLISLLVQSWLARRLVLRPLSAVETAA